MAQLSVDDGSNAPIQQYPRDCTLIVADSSGKGLDLSTLRVKFAVKKSNSMTPNTADIRVYNVEPQTAILIRKEFTQVVLQGGYKGNSGVIFRGNIKQVIIGRESATDTFIDIIAGDGDRAYNFALVRTTIAKNSTQQAQVNASIQAMTPKGVTAGPLGEFPPSRLPRGKVMFGNARNYLRDYSLTANKSWSIQDEKITIISNTGYLPGTALVLNSNTGMVGSPQQTNEGVNVKCLLNPNIRIGGNIQINEDQVQRLKINLDITDPKQIANSIPAPLPVDGVYNVLVVEHTGDNRGTDWYSSLVCLNVNITMIDPNKTIQVSPSG